MPFKLETVTTNDLAASIRVFHEAFYQMGGMGRFFMSGPTQSEEEIAKAVEKREKLLASEEYGKQVFIMKVVDTDLPDSISKGDSAEISGDSAEASSGSPDGSDMVGVAHWEFYTEPRTEEQLDSVVAAPPCPPGANEQAFEDFFRHLQKARRETLGKAPAAFLKTLAVRPEYQGKGVGTMLLKWGCEKADSLQIRGFLEASVVGYPLYERFGFVKQYETVFDLTDYGGEGIDRNIIMVREARRSSSGS